MRVVERMVPLLEHCRIALLTFHLSRNPCHQAAWGNITGHNRSCGNESTCANGDAIENNGSDSNQTTVFKGGPMHHGPMADGDIRSDQHR